jgi:hypothetical protein
LTGRQRRAGGQGQATSAPLIGGLTSDRRGLRDPCSRPPYAAPVLIDLQIRPAPVATTGADDAEPIGIEHISDLDEIVETTMCSCNAGDDNPY